MKDNLIQQNIFNSYFYINYFQIEIVRQINRI